MTKKTEYVLVRVPANAEERQGYAPIEPDTTMIAKLISVDEADFTACVLLPARTHEGKKIPASEILVDSTHVYGRKRTEETRFDLLKDSKGEYFFLHDVTSKAIESFGVSDQRHAPQLSANPIPVSWRSDEYREAMNKFMTGSAIRSILIRNTVCQHFAHYLAHSTPNWD